MTDTTRLIGSLQAAAFAQLALHIQLVRKMRDLGLISEDDRKEMFDAALLKIETMQTNADESERWVYELARGHIEAALPPFNAGSR